MARRIAPVDRRAFLQSALAAGAGLTAAGCCHIASFVPTEDHIADPIVPPSVHPFPTPFAPGAFSPPVVGGQTLAHTIDCHAHFFNGADVDVAGYLQGPVYDALLPTDPTLAKIAKDLACWAQELVNDLLVDASTEFDQLHERYVTGANASVMHAEIAAGTHRARLDAEREQRQIKILNRLAKGFQDHRSYDTLIQRAGLTAGPSQTEGVEPAAEPLWRMVRSRAAPRGAAGAAHGVSAPVTARVGGQTGDVVQFLLRMFSPRADNLQAFQRLYTDGPGAFGISGVLGALVDFNRWLPGDVRSTMRDQVRLHSLLSLLSGGYMLPIVGYNPALDVPNAVALETVQRAVTDFGCVGVKIYPGNGFYPAGNGSLPSLGQKHPPVPLPALEAALGAMFDWCSAHDVPVMAHAGETMGADLGADGYSGVAGWNRLLANFRAKPPNPSNPRAGSPVLNLGHFGGGAVPKEHPGDTYPADFAGLMVQANGDRVYGDLAFWNELQSCTDPAAVVSNGAAECDGAVARLAAARQVYPGLGTRLLYGTDWFMLAQTKEPQAYPADLAKALPKIQLEALPFFYANACACFGFATPPAGRENNRTRLECRFAAHGLPVPAWVSAAG